MQELEEVQDVIEELMSDLEKIKPKISEREGGELVNLLLQNMRRNNMNSRTALFQIL